MFFDFNIIERNPKPQTGQGGEFFPRIIKGNFSPGELYELLRVEKAIGGNGVDLDAVFL